MFSVLKYKTSDSIWNQESNTSFQILHRLNLVITEWISTVKEGVLSLFCYVTLTRERRCDSLKKITSVYYSQEKKKRVICSSVLLLHPEPGENTAPFPAVPSNSCCGMSLGWCLLWGKRVGSSKHRHSFHIRLRTSASWCPGHRFAPVPYQGNSPCSAHGSLARASFPDILQNIWHHLLITHWERTPVVTRSCFCLAWNIFVFIKDFLHCLYESR